MTSPGTITVWLRELETGDSAAAQKLWEHYYERLVRLAREKLKRAARRAADEEDVALSAFHSFCEGVKRGRFPQLTDRNNLWSLLVTITLRKAFDLIEREGRQKRNALGESAVNGREPAGGPAGLDAFAGSEPTPEVAAQVAEQYQRLLELLGDDQLRAVALLKMEGFTTEEIAAKQGCVPRTVERRLRAIRQIWSQESDE